MQITLPFLSYQANRERPKRVLSDETTNENKFMV